MHVKTRSSGQGCPYCAGRKICQDNCLSSINLKLAEQWHPSKNLPLTPEQVTPGSQKKAWWKCSKKHEYLSSILNRSRAQGCPYCAGKKASEENSLATLYPDIAEQWHPNAPLYGALFNSQANLVLGSQTPRRLCSQYLIRR